MPNNVANMAGRVEAPPRRHHRSHGTEIYQTTLCIERNSGTQDRLPLLFPAALLPQLPAPGRCLQADAQLRSHLSGRRGQRRLSPYLYAHRLTPAPDCPMLNFVRLTCCIRKPPIFRSTPLGREICDLLLEVPRPHGTFGYLIPAIAWGPLGERLSQLSEGTLLEVTGRFQSRPYLKRLPEGAQERVAYELSLVDAVAKSTCR